MRCTEWRKLVDRYRTAVRAYHLAVAGLDDEASLGLDEVWHRAEDARQQVDDARVELLHHEHESERVSWTPSDHHISDQSSDELVLGDQGQPGG